MYPQPVHFRAPYNVKNIVPVPNCGQKSCPCSYQGSIVIKAIADALGELLVQARNDARLRRAEKKNHAN